VRQLENICHWLTVMAPSQVVEAKDLPPEVLQASPLAGRADLPSQDTSSTALEDPASRPFEAAVTSNGLLSEPLALPVTAASPAPGMANGWESGLESEALALLLAGQTDVWDVLTRRFESKLIQTALGNTRGRRIEAAQKLGIGRNTITRKIQELGLE
jgi:two-component system nitrogen regulation response regulator GlnG